MTLSLTETQMATARRLSNAATYRAFGEVLPARNLRSLLGTSDLLSTKHDFRLDFGYKDDVDFFDLYALYKRNGVANALVSKTAAKTWETHPALTLDEDDTDDNPVEAEIARHFEHIRFWQMLAETDKRSLVGEYAGVIFQLADGKPFSAPVSDVPAGLKGLVNLVPAWEGQLQVSKWEQDRDSPHYGQPRVMTYTESSVDASQGKTRSFQVHPDRVYIWSQDRTTFNDSALEPVYDALTDMVKIRGASAEGFWKNAKSQPVLEAEKEVDFAQLATMLGTDLEGLPEALDNVVSDWNKGFDQSLMLQGMSAKTLGVTLPPQPAEYYRLAALEAAAAFNIPEKILFGSQTGERASTEDQVAWNRHNMSRRCNYVIPNIMDIVARLMRFGVLPRADWVLDWEDLTGATDVQRLEKAKGMAEINAKMLASGAAVFDDDEIRDVLEYGPREDEGLSELADPMGDAGV